MMSLSISPAPPVFRVAKITTYINISKQIRPNPPPAPRKQSPAPPATRRTKSNARRAKLQAGGRRADPVRVAPPIPPRGPSANGARLRGAAP